MARVKALPQFGRYDTGMLMYEVERANSGWCIESQYTGTGYILKDNTIVILGGKNGVLSIGKDQFLDFVHEMLGVYELAEARENAGIKYNSRHIEQEEIS